MMSMADRDGQRVSRVGAVKLGLRQQHADHQLDLRFVAVADADDSFFNSIGGVFSDLKSGTGGYQHGNAPCLSQFQCGAGILVDESVLYRRLMRQMSMDGIHQAVMELTKSAGQVCFSVGAHCSTGNELEAAAGAVDNSPTGAAQAWIDADDSN